MDDKRSMLGYVFHFDLGAISWDSKKKPNISLSIVEAKYISENATTCQTIWLRRILANLKENQEDGSTINCDNVSSIALMKILSFMEEVSTLKLFIILSENWLRMVKL